MAVANLALRIAKLCERDGEKVDIELVELGALLHDIGRSKTHSIAHGVIGARIIGLLGLDRRIRSIAERHVLVGISRDEARQFGLPPRDYLPITLEEKIVTYADKRVEKGRIVPPENVENKFRNWFGEKHPVIDRWRKLHDRFSKYGI